MSLPNPAAPSNAHGLLREQLMFAGWQDGDPIPDKIYETLTRLKNEALADLDEELTISQDIAVQRLRAKLAKNKFATITDLPPKQQREAVEFVQSSIEAVKIAQAQAAEEAALDSKLHPTIQGQTREHLKDLARRRAQSQMEQAPQEEPTGSYIVDDREPETPEPLPEAPRHCPCCNWDQSKTFEIEVTQEHKERFMVSVLGGSRFTDKISIFSGAAAITFRTLTTAENALLREELAYRSRDGKIVTDAAYVAAWLEGRLVMAVAEISVADKATRVFPEYHEWLKTISKDSAANAEATPLEQYTAQFYAQVQQEPLRKLLNDKFKAFDRLVETLLQRIEDPNFYKGIEYSA